MGARKRAQRAQQRGVGKLALALLNRLAAQHHRSGASAVLGVGRAAGELRYEPGLADAGLAAQKDDPGSSLARLMQRELQFRQFPDATYEVIRRESRAHDRSIP